MVRLGIEGEKEISRADLEVFGLSNLELFSYLLRQGRPWERQVLQKHHQFGLARNKPEIRISHSNKGIVYATLEFKRGPSCDKNIEVVHGYLKLIKLYYLTKKVVVDREEI